MCFCWPHRTKTREREREREGKRRNAEVGWVVAVATVARSERDGADEHIAQRCEKLIW